MKQFDLLIIGAGASGLLAAYDLSGKKIKLAILEARDRIGGRAHTITGNGFSSPVETGAEFVHGKLPITLSLLKKSGLSYHPVMGKSYTVHNGALKKEEEPDPHWKELVEKMNSLQNDMPLADFLESYFHGSQYQELRHSVTRFAQGFDAADPKKVSTISLRDEWENENEENQYRIEKGYSSLFNWMAESCLKNDAELHLSQPVSTIDHTAEDIIITCANGEKFSSKKVLVTVPLGVWQAPPGSQACITYIPSLPEKHVAAKLMGFGNVIKVVIEFTGFFWENNGTLSMPGAGFIFSDAIFPTWWTQNPLNVAQLNGWMAGPPSEKYKASGEEQLREIAIESLSGILRINKDLLKQKIKSIVVTDWSKDEWSMGAYSYDTIHSKPAKKILNMPVNDKLFFAGEALYEGRHNGTVEAAFESARNTLKIMVW
jgi:monoamine oxidase